MNPLAPILNAAHRLTWSFKRAQFYRDFAEMYRRSENVRSWLAGETENSVRNKESWRVWGLRAIAARYETGLSGGQTSFTLATVMPRDDRMMLAAIDRAVDKPAAFEAMAVAVEQQWAIKRIVAEYAVMPVVMVPLTYTLCTSLSAVILVIDKSVPVYLKPQLWTGKNWLAKEIAELTVNWGPMGIVALVLALAATIYSLPRWTGPARLRADKLPVYSLYRDFQSGLLLTTLATLLKTGDPLRGALDDIADSSPRWMRYQLRRVTAFLDVNPSASVQAFNRGLLSRQLISRMQTIARSNSGSFADVLMEMGTKETAVVHGKIRNAAILANAVAVGGLAILSVYMGLASLFVPNAFANVMDPSNMLQAQQQYQAQLANQPTTTKKDDTQ